MRMIKVGICALVGLVLMACGSENSIDDARTGKQLLTEEQNRVLGFQSPVADWTTTNGSTVTSSNDVTEGSASLSISVNGYTEISSVQIPGPASPRAQATFDIKLAQTLTWGDVRLVVLIPSEGKYWSDLGSRNLAGLSPGSYQALSFDVPADVQAAIGSGAPDLSFKIIINAQQGAGFLIDNLVVSEIGGSEPEEVATQPVELSLAVPRGTPISDYVVSATNMVTIDDRSTISEEGALASIANLGNGGIEIGGMVQAHSNLVSVGDVEFLRSQSHLYGGVTTGGNVLQQDSTVAIDGPIVENADVDSAVTTWTVDWPVNVTTDVSLPPDSPAVRLKPGAFDSIQIFSRSGLVLESGTYFVNSLVIEPDVNLVMDVSNGPVQLYVRDALMLRSPILYTGGEPGELLIGYIGNQTALFGEAVSAAVIAPNSTIELRRPNSGEPHRGAFFGKEVHVFSDSLVLHEPLDWSFACPSGDFDGDGVLDCFDECWQDPEKVEPGLCDCGTPDDDTDGDLIPDCMDECRFDASLSTRGFCKCPSEEGALAVGSTCKGGLLRGTFTCDEGGHCGPDGDDIPDTLKPQDDCWLRTLGGTAYWICGGGDGTGDPDDGTTSSGAPAGATDPESAAALCAKTPGGRLVQIDTYRENALVSWLVQGPSWIGAADFSSEGEWFWRGRGGGEQTQFWTGGASGRSFQGKFTAWAGRKPATDDGKDCATISKDGRWRAEDCSQLRRYVCEFSYWKGRDVDVYDFPKPKGMMEIIPGAIPDGDSLPPGYPVLQAEEPECVEFDEISDEGSLAAYRAQAEIDSELCEEECGQDADLDEDEAADCEAQYCQGSVAAPEGEDCNPMPGALVELDYIMPGTCETLDLAELPEDMSEADKLDALRDAQDCSGKELPDGTLPYDIEMDLRCGMQTVCLDLDENDQPQACSSDSDCTTGVCDCLEGYECDVVREGEDEPPQKYCINPNLENSCQANVIDTNSLTDGPPIDRLDADGNCIGMCFARVGCGTTSKENADEFFRRFFPGSVPADPVRCDEVRLCGPKFSDEAVTVEFDERDPFEDEPLPQTADEVLDYSKDFEDPCSSRQFPSECTNICFEDVISDECRRVNHRHPWCTNDVRTEGIPTHNENDTRSGSRGADGAPVSFALSPVSDMNFELEPLPYGAAKFSALAAAGVTAHVNFDVLKTKGSVEVVDLKAQISATICRASTAESKMEVVGVDFLPQIAGAAIFDSDDYLPETDGKKYSEQCEQAVADYVDSFDRVKKAMRDAQELITQYESVKEQGLTFTEDFCETFAGEGMRPLGMEGACPEEPHEVINRFVDYYNEQAKGLTDVVATLRNSAMRGIELGEALAEAFPEDVSFNGTYNYFADLGIANEESVTLVSLQFFIGPIPCLLEITSYVDYGIQGGFGLKVDPQVLLGGRGEFAQVGAEVGPYANSGITLFVGAGFNIGILKLAVGVEGGVTLGHIALPAVVSAGLALQRDEDERPLPGEVSEFATSNILFPSGGQDRYAYQFTYNYGVGFEVTDILTGFLDGTMKVKFAFFSKKFSQRIATFDAGLGIGPVMLISGGGGEGLDNDLGGGTEYEGEVAKGNPTWKQSFESLPFMELEHLSAPSYCTGSSADPDDCLTKSEGFKTDRVFSLFYDELCKDCVPTGETCGRDADCCETDDACVGEGDNKVCGPPACLPTGEECSSDSDCCSGERCLLKYNGSGFECGPVDCTLREGDTCQNTTLPTKECCFGTLDCAGGYWGKCQVVVK